MNGTTPSSRLGTNDEFRIVQGNRHGRVVSILSYGRLWVVWWDEQIDDKFVSEIVTARTCRLETEKETREIYLQRSKAKYHPYIGTFPTLSEKTAKGFDAANQAAWEEEDIDYNPPDTRTVGQRLADGFGMINGDID